MLVQIKPWGNSQGVRFTREFLSSAGIQPDEELIAEAADGRIILSRRFRHVSLKERAERYGGQLNLSDEIEWDSPAGSEVW